MAEESKRPKRPQVLIDPELYRRIGVIAAWLDVSVPDWVNNRLGPIVDEAFAEVSAEITKAQAARKNRK